MPDRPAPTGEYLSVRTVAARLDLSQMTIYRMIEAGELPAIRVGRSFRIHGPGLDTWLAAHQVVPTVTRHEDAR